jgi:hypothetical protein
MKNITQPLRMDLISRLLGIEFNNNRTDERPHNARQRNAIPVQLCLLINVYFEFLPSARESR